MDHRINHIRASKTLLYKDLTLIKIRYEYKPHIYKLRVNGDIQLYTSCL